MTVVTRVPFNPENHKIIALNIPIIGFASGIYCTIRPNADLSNSDVGGDGEVHTNMIANNTATMTLRMAYDTPIYQLMRAAAVLYQQTGFFLPSASVNTANLLDTTFSANSNIIAQSEDTYSMNAADMYREYRIMLHNAIRV